VAAGCTANVADGAPPEGETGSIEEAFSTLEAPPNCNDQSTPHTTVRAIRHSAAYLGPGAGGYWQPAPTHPDPCAQCTNYETKLATFVHQSNRYEYLLQLVSTTEQFEPLPVRSQTRLKKFVPPPDRKFFGVGVEYQASALLPPNPPRYSQPPAAPVFPTFSPRVFFGPTAHDWHTEVRLATGPTWAGLSTPPGENLPVDSEFWKCVTVIDETNKPIDFFVLMDEHDPSGGHPW
jgi:hypothetical protein